MFCPKATASNGAGGDPDNASWHPVLSTGVANTPCDFLKPKMGISVFVLMPVVMST